MTLQKRLFDQALALLATLILALPFALLLAVLLVTSGRPLFYISERMKAPGVPFPLC